MSQALILPQYPGDFSLSGHTHNYASASHSHSQYLTSHQSLTNYATKTYVDNAVAGIDTSTVPSHTHDYASSSHTHSYASTSHTHSGYASSSHSHSGYASSSHTHSASDISGLDSGGGGSAGWTKLTSGTLTSFPQTSNINERQLYKDIVSISASYALYKITISGSVYSTQYYINDRGSLTVGLTYNSQRFFNHHIILNGKSASSPTVIPSTSIMYANMYLPVTVSSVSFTDYSLPDTLKVTLQLTDAEKVAGSLTYTVYGALS